MEWFRRKTVRPKPAAFPFQEKTAFQHALKESVRTLGATEEAVRHFEQVAGAFFSLTPAEKARESEHPVLLQGENGKVIKTTWPELIARSKKP